MVYRRQNGGDLTLESAAFNGGRFVATASGIEPHFFVTDHLGSVRVIVDSEGTVLERNNYDPFGKRWNEPESILSDNRYRYNGKEEQAFAGLPYTDYGARMYDPRTGRWLGTDQLAELFFSTSSYAFCGNNPVVRIDSDGKIWETVWDVGITVYDTGAAIYNHITGDHETAKSHWIDAGVDLAAILVPFVPGGVSKAAKIVDKATDAIKGAEKATETAKGIDKALDAAKCVENAVDAATDTGKAAKKARNPYGSKGKPDHQNKVNELEKKAEKELLPGEYIVREKKIKIDGSDRRPDIQIIGNDGQTRKVFEAERYPGSRRNLSREEEYRRLKIEQETHSLQ